MSPIAVRARLKKVKAFVRNTKCVYRGVPYEARIVVSEYFDKKSEVNTQGLGRTDLPP